jgi:hypothetical protein
MLIQPDARVPLQDIGCPEELGGNSGPPRSLDLHLHDNSELVLTRQGQDLLTFQINAIVVQHGQLRLDMRDSEGRLHELRNTSPQVVHKGLTLKVRDPVTFTKRKKGLYLRVTATVEGPYRIDYAARSKGD